MAERMPPPTTAVADAERAIELAPSSPRRARVLAESILHRAGNGAYAEARAVAERALGLAALELRDGEAAVDHLRRAVGIAADARLKVRAAEARMSLGRALLYTGDSRGAFREIDRAGSSLRGLDGARLQLQRAILLHHHHRLDEALEGYSRALAAFRRHGDRLWEARALNNRGLVHAYRGSLAAAERDLRTAAALYAELDLELMVADAEHNLGWIAARRGDVPAALEAFDGAEARRRAERVPVGGGLSDRCELLLGVRLVAEARGAAERAVAALARGSMALEEAEARLMLAEAALAGDDFETARGEAERAAQGFARQRRPRWAALARFAALRADFLEHGPSPERLRAAQRSARALADAGWTAAALDARLLSARIALALGRRDTARRSLADVRTGARDPVDLRVRSKYATALLALADGDRPRAYRALRSGVRLLHDYRVALGATELRAQVGGHAEELARLGLRLALRDGDPRRVLAWLDERRAAALGLRPVRPPDNEALAAELADLRRIVADVREGAFEGRDLRELRRRQVALEESIRRRTRTAPGTAGVAAPRAAADLDASLGERALVAYTDADDRLHAVTVAGGRRRLHELGASADARAALDALRFALRRLARRGTPPASLAAVTETARAAAARLDELLVQPLARELDGRPLVLVPTGSLHAMPWALLPGLAGRPLVVAPSAAAWAAAETRARRVRRHARVAVAAGPGLAFAPAEARAVARLHGAEPLLDGAATATAVLGALDGAAVAHLAAHGSFRADNPLFSSLDLADGPLTVYDLESLDEAPSLCVLSACESGLSEVHAGDELMGLSATLLALGSATIVASVVAVPDEASTALMSAFHRGLADGRAPAEALVRAHDALGDDTESTAARAAFVCFGAG